MTSTDQHPLIPKSVWLAGNSTVARRIGRPLRRFMEVEAAGGIVMLAAVVVALVWVNSPWQSSYLDFWNSEVHISAGSLDIFSHHSLVEFVNDALMVFFFFVVGLEIKREIAVGHLSDTRNIMLPVVAALGGMIVPAAVYLLFNLGPEGDLHGWGIPMATDIAFALGVISLLGNRIPRALKIFLLTLAIADDIGAILVIAIFYTEKLALGWLFVAVGLLVIIRLMAMARIWWFPVYVLLGGVVWWATYKSGVHATIAGVALSLLTPAKPLLSFKDAQETAQWIEDKHEVYVVDIRWAHFNIAESVSVVERLEKLLHPVVTFVVVPIFALANAGVILSQDSVNHALTSPVSLGIVIGLLIGKSVGITLFTWVGVKLKLARLPQGINMTQIFGMALIAAIGFTVALFITALAFDASQSISDAKIAILAASIIASLGGLYVLATSCPNSYELPEDHDPDEDPAKNPDEADPANTPAAT